MNQIFRVYSQGAEKCLSQNKDVKPLDKGAGVRNRLTMEDQEVNLYNKGVLGMDGFLFTSRLRLLCFLVRQQNISEIMNLLDVRTVVFSFVTINVICLSVMAFLWFQNRERFGELGFWLADFAIQFIGILLVALRGIVPVSYPSSTVCRPGT